MNLLSIEFELIWHNNVELHNLRKYIHNNIIKKGEVLRWSINNIEISSIENHERVLTINAVVIKK